MNPHILIVDDEKYTRAALARVVNSLGYTTNVASNGLEAINLLKKKDLI